MKINQVDEAKDLIILLRALRSVAERSDQTHAIAVTFSIPSGGFREVAALNGYPRAEDPVLQANAMLVSGFLQQAINSVCARLSTLGVEI